MSDALDRLRKNPRHMWTMGERAAFAHGNLHKAVIFLRESVVGCEGILNPLELEELQQWTAAVSSYCDRVAWFKKGFDLADGPMPCAACRYPIEVEHPRSTTASGWPIHEECARDD